MALKQHPDIAWPLIFSALAQTQTELLGGRGAGQAPGLSFCDSECPQSLNVVTWHMLQQSSSRPQRAVGVPHNKNTKCVQGMLEGCMLSGHIQGYQVCIHAYHRSKHVSQRIAAGPS